jgi:hypothetical protein
MNAPSRGRRCRSASTRRGVLGDDVLIRHESLVPVDHERVGALLDTLGSADDRLWPHELWPAQALDRPLGVGATGHNGPVRFAIEAYEPGRRVRYRLLGPSGFSGWHEFTVEPSPDGTRLAHTYRATHRGPARIMWPLALRPLHDAATRDCLAKAERELGLPAERPRRSPWVRLLALGLPLSDVVWPSLPRGRRDA